MKIAYLIVQCENYVQKNWVYSEKTSFEKKHLLARGVHLILAPASFFAAALNTIIALGAVIATVLTAGNYEKMSLAANARLTFSKKLLSNPYKNILRTINPKAKFSNRSDENTTSKQRLIDVRGDGFVHGEISSRLQRKGETYYDSKNFLKRHVASRLTYLLLAISSLVTRAIDGMIAIPATALSILTAGKFETLNNLSYRTLQATGIIDDLSYSTIKLINPWTII